MPSCLLGCTRAGTRRWSVSGQLWTGSGLRTRPALARSTLPKTQTRPRGPGLCGSSSPAASGTRLEESLADEGEVVIAAGSVRDRGAAVGRDAQQGLVGDGAAIDAHIAPTGVANADGVAGIAAAV